MIGGKKELTDAGTRVPLIVNWLGTTPSGEVSDDLIDLSDFLPTLLDLAGGSVPSNLTIDGVSFADRIQAKEFQSRSWVFSEWNNRRWVRNRDWKLYQDGTLYFMRDDVSETSPIVDDSGIADAGTARKELDAVFDQLFPNGGKP